MVTHDTALAASADRVVTIIEGRLLAAADAEAPHTEDIAER
jgi:ABC-type lipoprotein export system ATPase subunit